MRAYTGGYVPYRFLVGFKSRRRVLVAGLAFAAVANQLSVVALAAAPARQTLGGDVPSPPLVATLEGRAIGNTVHLTAHASVDLTATPWSLGILDGQGHLIAQPCKLGNRCVGDFSVVGEMPQFTAVIGTLPAPDTSTNVEKLISKVAGPASLVNVQVQSNPVRPVRMLWGVDSCQSFTTDPNAGNGLYPQVAGRLGAPDFWGRYLTQTVCPGISEAEIAAAHVKHMGILPIYNDYHCSHVVGYDTGTEYATEAVAAAKRLGVPRGRGLAIDIEPPSEACPGAANVDTGFIQGWYDGILLAHYQPVYYANSTPGSGFATQWCYAVAALPYIGRHSYLWSFEPSLLGRYSKSKAPSYAPEIPTCLGHVQAWQYQISAGSDPDVDQDEAYSDLPLWYP